MSDETEKSNPVPPTRHDDSGERYDSAAVNRARLLLDKPPEMIGRYRILESIGGGGMGEVYRAEQRVPVRREVAIKLIKMGMDTKLVIARFEAERQALAMMDHPNIAKVYDADADETGRPYFVMEYVKGKPITEYSDANHLTIDERLRLFEQVCHAIQHAHHKGIIHRDLKPSNVLVSTQDGKPHAKVIDFGISKATSQRLTNMTLYTQHDQFIGTPQYMSPEQADGSLDIDTRTDVYSLGVMLYELLTGSTPFDSADMKKAAMEQIKKMIRDIDPPKPSTRLHLSTETLPSLAASRRVEPRRLNAILRGELDWLVMKALEKDRARRYDTPNSLAEDIDNYLSGQPVLAAPPSLAYRARKFIRRYRVPVAAAIAFGMILVAAAVSISFLALRLREQVQTTGAALADVTVQGQRATIASARADKEARNALNLLQTTETSLAEQRVTSTRLFIRTNQFSKARSLIETIAGRGISDADRRWLAWDCVRRSQELFRINLRDVVPGAAQELSAITSGGMINIDVAKRLIVFKVGRDAHGAAAALPAIPDRAGDVLSLPPLTDNLKLESAELEQNNVLTGPASKSRAQPNRLTAKVVIDGKPATISKNYPAGIQGIQTDLAAGRIAVMLSNGRLIVLTLQSDGLRETFMVDTESEGVFDCEFEPGKQVLWIGQYDWLVKGYVITPEADTRTTRLPQTHRETTRYVAVSNDGTVAATMGYDQYLKIWRTSDFSLIRELDLRTVGSKVVFPRAVNVHFVGKSNSRLIFGVYESHVWEWNSAITGESPVQLPIEGMTGKILVSPDGRRVFTAALMDNKSKQIIEYDRESRQSRSLKTYTDGRFAYAMTLSPDGQELVWCTSATGDHGGSKSPDEVASIDLQTLESRVRISGFSQGLRDIDLSPDGRTLAVASRDGTARLYHWPAAELFSTIDVQPGLSHTNIVSSVRFHPTEPIVATATQNNKIGLWNSQTGKELATIDAEPSGTRGYLIGFLKEAVFSPDGNTLYACIGDERSGELVAVDLEFWDTAIDNLLGKNAATPTTQAVKP